LSETWGRKIFPKLTGGFPEEEEWSGAMTLQQKVEGFSEG
jgi:hypothetical protein